MPEIKPLTNIHDAMSRAIESEKERVPLVNANFKINPLKKEIAEQICEKNATTLSAFLRECAEGLIQDYMGEKASGTLES